MSTPTLVIGIFTGALGAGYFVYGRRQAKYVPLFSGMGLCAYSYFVNGWFWLCVIGVALAVAPLVLDF